jgi:hypothetical protein
VSGAAIVDPPMAVRLLHPHGQTPGFLERGRRGRGGLEV